MNPLIEPLYRNLTSSLLGARMSAECLITGLLAEGHVLIQGAPGLGKTTLAKVLARSIDCVFKRIQFTPDLLPADILGHSVYDQADGVFKFHPGPIFGQVILADEINRASPRVQSALLESMNESQVSIDGTTYSLERPFCVIATQNHTGSVGTFPLPEPQLDRFLLSFDMEMPDEATQLDILEYHAAARADQPVSAVMRREDIQGLIAAAAGTYVGREVMGYIVSLCEATRQHKDLAGGASPRASIAIMQAARANACFHGHDAVYPDHVKRVMPYVLRHRLVGHVAALDPSHHAEEVLRDILSATPVPVGLS